MCVIVYKPKNIKISQADVNAMWDSNPHGAGFALCTRPNITISKGYEDPDQLFQDLKQLQNYSMVLHFRYATHGDMSNEMTHPFIITPCTKEASQVYTETDKPIIVHNGIINGFGNDKISDTLDFTCNVLAHLPNIHAMKQCLHLTGSKYILLHSGKIHFIGKFETIHGLKVSNTYWDNSKALFQNTRFYFDN